MKLSNLEKETCINFNEAEDFAEIYTHNRSLITKLESFCKKYPDLYKAIENTDSSGRFFTAPKSQVKIVPKRVLSDEQKEKLTQQLFINIKKAKERGT